MSESDRAVVDNMIRTLYKGEVVTPARGLVPIGTVLKGGLTDHLINLSVRVADEHYSREIKKFKDTIARLLSEKNL